MSQSIKKYSFILLFEQFIKANKQGRRLQKNGKRLSTSTVEAYEWTLINLKLFDAYCDFELRIIPVNRLNNRTYRREKNYWKKFYLKFTDFLYKKKGCFDNYVGHNIKIIRVFFRYLHAEKNISIGEIYKDFYVRKETPPIITLSVDQLNFLIYNKDFEKQLRPIEQEVKDMFVFGCVAALRHSDLSKLSPTNINFINGGFYLSSTSKKTKTYTQIKLPDFAVNIYEKYLKRNRKKHLFPQYSLFAFNRILKRICEKAGWTYPVEKYRERRGEPIAIKNKKGEHQYFRYCDLISSHAMRRTAITNMLILGVEESFVRRISGHSDSSSEFYRYVNYAQTFVDSKTEDYFNQLEKLRKAS